MLGDTGIPCASPCLTWDPFFSAGFLGLTDVQKGVLDIVFRVADDMGMLLIDLQGPTQAC